MTESVHQVVRDLEEKLSVLFQQMVTETEDLKNEVRELNRTCDTLRGEKATLKAENLKLKTGILNTLETMRDSLSALVEEAGVDAAEGKYAEKEIT